MLREELLVPLRLTPYAVKAALNVPRTRIERIAREEKPATADAALRLGKFFKTAAAFWMNMQVRFDVRAARLDRAMDDLTNAGSATITFVNHSQIRSV
ncbi:MAG: HigA family addiction module antitoxin [Nitrobacter sp.]